MAFREITGIARETASLPPAGAYDDGLTIACNQYEQIDFLISYTTDAGAGSPGGVTYKLEWSNEGTRWYQICEVQAPVMVSGADIVDTTQRVEVSYVATTAGLERFMTPNFDIASQFVRIRVKENTNEANPGVVKIEYFMNGESQ